MRHVDSIISRMVEASEARNPTQMLKSIGLSPNLASTWRKRGGVPDGAITKVAEQFDCSIVWLKTGEGDQSMTGLHISAPVEQDIDMLEWLLENRQDLYLQASGFIKEQFVKAQQEQ